jgi:hypothetical protein
MRFFSEAGLGKNESGPEQKADYRMNKLLQDLSALL